MTSFLTHEGCNNLSSRCFSTETLSCKIANAQHSSCRQCSALYLSDEPIEANRTRLTGDVYTARARGAEPLLAWRWKARTADEGGANIATQPESVSSCFTPLMVCTNCVETASLLNTLTFSRTFRVSILRCRHGPSNLALPALTIPDHKVSVREAWRE